MVPLWVSTMGTMEGLRILRASGPGYQEYSGTIVDRPSMPPYRTIDLA